MTAAPTLSVVCLTMNSATRLESWAARVLEYADELVILVDSATEDRTLELARSIADTVAVFEHGPRTGIYHDWALRKARGDWILFLDDDEVMSRDFARCKDELLADRRLTHYWIPYRWVVRTEQGDGWLRQFPWHPNPRLRLVRNIGSVFWHRGRVHSHFDVLGEGRVLSPQEGVMYHLDFLQRSRDERLAKVARYRRNGVGCEEYYLYEDYVATTPVEAVPDEEASRAPLPLALERLEERRRRPPRDLDGEVRPLAAELERIAGLAENADVFAADYLAHTTPTTMLPNRGYTAEVTLRNRGRHPWRSSGSERGRIQLGYHWVHPEHGTVLRGGDRSLLPHTVEPGETVTVLAGVWAPYDPGRYTLQWDLRREEVAWFSERGVAPLEVAVEVEDRDRLLPRYHDLLAELPPPEVAAPEPSLRARAARIAARLRRTLAARVGGQPTDALAVLGRNVVPVGPVRILDSRDASGVEGRLAGPLPGGTTVTLLVPGWTGVPDHATGVLVTVLVPEATYNGYVATFPAGDEARSSGFVTTYFAPGAPSSGQTVCALNEGRLSLRLSEGPGTAELIVDVSAFLR